MNTFLIADDVLYGPAFEWAQQHGNLYREYDEDGVHAYTVDNSMIILVRPKGFSPKRLSSILQERLDGAHELKIIAPSAIQYFASKMRINDPIFQAIGTLSQYPISVLGAAIFRMVDHKSSGNFKHSISYAAFPESIGIEGTSYISSDGQLLNENSLDLRSPVTSVSVPLVFYHSGLARQQFNKASLIKSHDENGTYGYERMAYDELMLRFPSRKRPSDDEVTALCGHFSLSAQDVHEVWAHNRTQWDLVLTKLRQVGFPMSGPVTRESEEKAYTEFNHLIFSGFLGVIPRLDLSIPQIRHIGVPLFARNGVTIPLDINGISTSPASASMDVLKQRIDAMLHRILKGRFSNEIASRENRKLALSA